MVQRVFYRDEETESCHCVCVQTTEQQSTNNIPSYLYVIHIALLNNLFLLGSL